MKKVVFVNHYGDILAESNGIPETVFTSLPFGKVTETEDGTEIELFLSRVWYDTENGRFITEDMIHDDFTEYLKTDGYNGNFTDYLKEITGKNGTLLTAEKALHDICSESFE